MNWYTMCSNKTIDTIELMLTALDLLKDIYSYMYHRRDLRKSVERSLRTKIIKFTAVFLPLRLDVDAFNIQCVATGYSLSLCNIHRKQQEQINNKSLRYNGRDVSPLKEDDIQHVKLNKHSLYHCSISQLIHHTECCWCERT